VDQSGNTHTISDPQPVTAIDTEGDDVTSVLSARDNSGWRSDLTWRDFGNVSHLFDTITMTLLEAPDEGTAKLVMDIAQTPLNELTLWYYYHYFLGTPNLDYLINRAESDPEFMPLFDQAVAGASTVVLQYWNGSDWVDYDYLFNYPIHFGDRMYVVPIDMSVVQGNQIRLMFPADWIQIDYAAVDYTEDADVTVTQLQPTEATLHREDILSQMGIKLSGPFKYLYQNMITEDVLSQITATDDSYTIVEQGDYINYKFEALAEPEAGMHRTFFLPASGYYYVTSPEVPEDKIENMPLVEEISATPLAYNQWILPRYVAPQDYPYSEYYSPCVKEAPAPFPVNWDSLDTDYVGITVAECTDFNETPPPAHKVGDWWMWNVSYDGNLFEDVGANCYDNTIRNYAFLFETVNSTGDSVTVYYNQSQREALSGHTVTNTTRIDRHMDISQNASGRGSQRAVFTGNGIAIQALNTMFDAELWASPYDATVWYKFNSLPFVNAISETTPTNNWYSMQLTNHAAEDYGYPYAMGDTFNTHEYYWAQIDSLLAPSQNVERDWNTRVVSYEENYNVSDPAEYIMGRGYSHDGGVGLYDVWITDQYQTSNSISGDNLTPEAGSKIYWYAPDVHHLVRKIDAYQYIGAEEFSIQAYEVGTYSASNLVCSNKSSGQKLNVSVNITNTDSSNGKYINVLCILLDTDAFGDDAGEPYPNGKTVYPNMGAPDSGTWPFYNAIKHTWFNASETKTLTWSNIYTMGTGPWRVWCQGATYSWTN